ncbi:Flp family type IVb pilin [Novosphingobium sp.]|uniref:Flp family type IVb pilin n=1 Tax=Novosphingobium sp. TaxID=1874826 RepID=UPI0028A99B74|nr:Flp family type IVb pilin [Novosphingobium sp.]
MKFLAKLRRNEQGATAIEYGLIAALIAVAAIAAMQGLGSNLKTTFATTSGAIAEGNTASTQDGAAAGGNSGT